MTSFFCQSKQGEGRTQGRGGNKSCTGQDVSKGKAEWRGMETVRAAPSLLSREEETLPSSWSTLSCHRGPTRWALAGVYTPDSNSKTTFSRHLQHTLVVPTKTRREKEKWRHFCSDIPQLWDTDLHITTSAQGFTQRRRNSLPGNLLSTTASRKMPAKKIPKGPGSHTVRLMKEILFLVEYVVQRRGRK